MAGEQVAAKGAEGKVLEITKDNSEQAKWECESALGQLECLVKLLMPKDDEDDSDLVLRFYHRRGLASILESSIRHIEAVWSEVLGPVLSYIDECEKAAEEDAVNEAIAEKAA